jgi:hypothetical protein
LYISEADFEFLIRTLSEARSRATELAVTIGSRLGSDHRLAELATSAASKIENMLREIRSSAAEQQDMPSGLTGLHGALKVASAPVAPAPQRSPQMTTATPPGAFGSFATRAGLESEHWLPMFVEDLLAQLRASGAITFEMVERLLQQRKDDFLRDFLIARRMYRTYPKLFPEIRGEVEPLPGQTTMP